MVALSALLIAERVRPDDNGNFDVTGVMDTFRLDRPDVPRSQDWIRDAGASYPGRPGIVASWYVPIEDRGQPWEGKLEIWAGGTRCDVLGRAMIETAAHSCKWLVQLAGLPLYIEGEHELRAYARPATDPPGEWHGPLALYPYVVIVEPVAAQSRTAVG